MILGIESSCDESALSLYDRERGVIGEWVHSQIQKHADYGGVVPDLAVNEHLTHFFPLLDRVRSKCELPGDLSRIAVTCGPGLVGCLGIGLSVAKTLGLLWGIPVEGVNHLRGHAFSPFMSLGLESESDWQTILPHLGLIVSGGNTLLFKMDEDRRIEIIARTVDDAAGEALDKGAKLLGIAYPGGAELERRAKGGDDKAFPFPRAFPEKNERKFSFSGLKTSLLYTLRKMKEEEIENRYADLCASYQAATVDQLLVKSRQSLQEGGFRSIGLSGGVANNQVLRSALEKLSSEEGVRFLAAEMRHTGDNASMIAFAAEVDRNHLWSNENQQLSFNPSLQLDEREGSSS
jgi:N6-L-threonylcarbamoyladenine synthase